MNILYRSSDALEFDKNSLKDRMLFYQEHYYDNVYFLNPQGTFKGYLNYVTDSIGQMYLERESVNTSISIDSVYEWFYNNPGKFRIPVVDNKGILLGEYYDSDSNEECLYKRIEDRALEILTCLKNDLQKWAKGLKISILDNSIMANKIKTLLPDASVVKNTNNNSDITIDSLYTPHVRKLLGIGNEKTKSPSQILIPILIKKVYDFCLSNKVSFYVFDGIKKSDIQNKNKKEIENESNSLERVLQDVNYLKEFCGEDSQSFEMLLKHTIDLNQISRTINNGIYNELVDFSDGDINFENGMRLTTGVPAKSIQTIHIYGPCVVQGLCVVDSQTIPSLLQNILNDSGYSFTSVVNHGISYGKDLLNDLLYMMATPLAPHDIIVWVNGFDSLEQSLFVNYDIPIIDGKSFAVGFHNWYLNNPFHCNSKANKMMAQIIFNNIRNNILSKPYFTVDKSSLIERECIPLSYDNERLLKSKELDDYVKELEKHRKHDGSKIIGCVVVNANPCTNGHIHLIKQALKEVDYLFVFLVEQNTGPFCYLDRELMLKESLKGVDRVEIISGGSIFTTSKGYPGYFVRTGKNINPLLNHKIFSERIAPALKISKRFFGEEPNDFVTRQLNVTALEYLPKHGVDVKIINRLTFNGIPVSAKNVRKLYFSQQYEQMRMFVPKFVYEHLQYLSNKKTDMMIISNNIERNNISYPGANKKFGIVIEGINYMLKIADTDEGRLCICSESLGTFICHNQLQLKTSELKLVIYEGQLSLLSKGWKLRETEQFFPLSSYYEELLDELDGCVPYSYDLFKRIVMNKSPKNYDYIQKCFWLLNIVDYLICNSHSAGNIGFIHGDEVVLSPIYDCETRLKDLQDQSFKNLNYPVLHMDFGLTCNSSFYVFKNLDDKYKDYALEYAKKHLNISDLNIDSDIKEENYMLEVITYRYNKLFK